MKCPGCGGVRDRHWVASAEYDPIAPQLLGGVVAALVFALSRKRRFECARCGELFETHTTATSAWLALWIAFLLVVAAGLFGLLLGTVLNR